MLRRDNVLNVKLISCCAFLFLTACDAAYVASRVTPVEQPQPDALGVDVIALTPATIARANQSRYAPRQEPSGTIATTTASANVPAPVFEPELRPAPVQTNMPRRTRVEEYHLGTGDVVSVVLDEERSAAAAAAMNQSNPASNTPQTGRLLKTIRQDGSITLPRLGTISLGGKTLREAEDAMQATMLSRQLNLGFSLDVDQFASKTFSVDGAVSSPDNFPITIGPSYLRGAIAKANGLNKDVDPQYAVVKLYRDGQTYQIGYEELQNQSSETDVVLKDGDNIFVENTFNAAQAMQYNQEQLDIRRLRREDQVYERDVTLKSLELRISQLRELEQRIALGSVKQDFVYVAGNIETQYRYNLPFEKTAVLADALYDNGGINSLSGNPAAIYVLRADFESGRITAFQLDATNAANLVLSTLFELRPRDIIFIGNQPIMQWNTVISQLLPSLSVARTVQ
jgi:polysaccharide export outer membrane protein